MDRRDGAWRTRRRVSCTKGPQAVDHPATVVTATATPGRRSRTASRAVDARSGTRLSCAVIEYWPGPDATGCAGKLLGFLEPSD